MDRESFGDLVGQALRTASGLSAAVLGSFRANGSMALLSVALSSALYVFISTEQNPPRTGVFPIRVPVLAVNQAPDVEVLGPLETVLLRITAPSDLWDNLSDRSFRAIVDVSDEKEGEATLPVQVEANDGRVRILDVIPREVAVQFDAAKSATVPVKMKVVRAPPLGYSYEEPKFTLTRVTVHGPERLVNLVDAAVADIDLSDARTNLRQSYRLTARTLRGNDITGVRIDPSDLTAEVAITRHIDYVSLVVVPEVRGTPANGYWVSKLRVDPTVVAVVGPQDILAALTTVRTVAVDVSNLTGTVTRTVGLDVPAGVSLVNRSTVQVEVTLQPLSGTAMFQVAPRLVGVPPGFTAQVGVNSIEVVVRGEGPALQEATLDKIGVTLTVTARTAGTVSIEPQVTTPPGTNVVRISPARVSVTLIPSTP
ncbi:MAG: hypothetical protein EXR52_02395 [Dehalococcoidia bacterium]|nr:hypothetical protein [Dehalococcoidia bacterium]